MIKAVLPALAMCCALSVGPVHAQNNIEVLRDGSGNPDKVLIDLGELDNQLSQAAKSVAVWNACGDQVALNFNNLAPRGNSALATATLSFTRYQCVNISEPVCKGFKCQVETRQVKTKLYATTVPVQLQISPKPDVRFGVNFAVDAQNAAAASKVLLGNDKYYHMAVTALSKEASAALQTTSNDLKKQIAALGGDSITPIAATSFIKNTAGNLGFEVQLTK